MLNQVSRALAQLFRPITTAKSSADRDPSGNTFERFTPPKKEDRQSEGKSDSNKKSNPTQALGNAETENQPSAQVVPFSKQTPEEVVDARRREIRNSQAWLTLKNLFKGSKSAQVGTKEGPDAYEQSTGSKKGVILDKKAG